MVYSDNKFGLGVCFSALLDIKLDTLGESQRSLSTVGNETLILDQRLLGRHEFLIPFCHFACVLQ